jgi:hypothetical protein
MKNIPLVPWKVIEEELSVSRMEFMNRLLSKTRKNASQLVPNSGDENDHGIEYVRELDGFDFKLSRIIPVRSKGHFIFTVITGRMIERNGKLLLRVTIRYNLFTTALMLFCIVTSAFVIVKHALEGVFERKLLLLTAGFYALYMIGFYLSFKKDKKFMQELRSGV